MKKSLVLTVLASGLLGLSGCGSAAEESSAASTSSVPEGTSSQSASSATASTTSEPVDDDLRIAVQTYSDAFLTGDADTAYDLFTARCKERTSEVWFGGIVASAADLYGAALPLSSYSAVVSGDFARVTYTYDVPAINQTSEPWAREDGQWKQDDC